MNKFWLGLFLLSALILGPLLCAGAADQGVGLTLLKKKIVFVKDDDSDFFNGFATYIEDQFALAGWGKDKADFIVLSMEGKLEKAAVNVKEILDLRPDVVYINGAYIQERILPLMGTGIPVVVIAGVDYEMGGRKVFLDPQGRPLGNITGAFTSAKDLEKNSFQLLDRISPLKGKEVAILIQSSFFTERVMKSTLDSLNMKMAYYKEFAYFEDFQEALLAANKDDSIGWIIADGPITRRDGKEWNRIETFHWEYTQTKKPGFAFWQNNVENGCLAGLALDSMGYVNATLPLAYQILAGKNPKDLMPVYNDKILMLLNMKAAKQIGVEIPLDVLGAAWRIYTDYEGTFQGKK